MQLGLADEIIEVVEARESKFTIPAGIYVYHFA